jgi:hypothetical protein
MCWRPGLPTKLKSRYPRDGAPLEASRSCEGEEALGVRKERLVATFDNTVVIRRLIEEVFAFLSHFENVPAGTTSGSSRNCWRDRLSGP